MTACEAVKCKDNLKTSLQTIREKAPECFKQTVNEAERLDIESPVVTHWRRLHAGLTMVQITQDLFHLSNFLLHNVYKLLMREVQLD